MNARNIILSTFLIGAVLAPASATEGVPPDLARKWEKGASQRATEAALEPSVSSRHERRTRRADITPHLG